MNKVSDNNIINAHKLKFNEINEIIDIEIKFIKGNSI